MEIVLHGTKFCKLRRLINQSINLYLYQATNAHIAKPNTCKKLKKQTQHYDTTQILPHRQTQERETKPLLERDVHIYIFQ